MHLTSGPATVIASGEATTFAGCGLHFGFEVDRVPFTLNMTFSTDDAVEDVAVQVTSTEHGLALHCTNFDDASGRGSAVPVLLGPVEDDLIFVHFRVLRFGKTEDRTVHYTFYRTSASVLGDD
jgi:hypothetical protein